MKSSESELGLKINSFSAVLNLQSHAYVDSLSSVLKRDLRKRIRILKITEIMQQRPCDKKDFAPTLLF